MGESTSDNNESLDGAEEGFFPERCPICSRINFKRADDYCEHFWGATYDNEMIDGPFSQEFEELWAALQDTYQATDDTQVRLLITNLHANGLAEIAEATVNCDKFWWLSRVIHKNFIEPEASLASGSGWNLYQEEDGWFEGTIRQLRTAVQVAREAITEGRTP